MTYIRRDEQIGQSVSRVKAGWISQEGILGVLLASHAGHIPGMRFWIALSLRLEFLDQFGAKSW